MTIETLWENPYVAWGVDNETNDEGHYWVAIWTDDGPASGEELFDSRDAAKTRAEEWATAENLEAVEVDEFGAIAN
jgi:hypothetical protein